MQCRLIRHQFEQKSQRNSRQAHTLGAGSDQSVAACAATGGRLCSISCKTGSPATHHLPIVIQQKNETMLTSTRGHAYPRKSGGVPDAMRHLARHATEQGLTPPQDGFFSFWEAPQISCWEAGNHKNPLHQAVGEICNQPEKAGNVGRLQSWLDSSCAGPGGLTFGNTQPSRATETSIESNGDAMYTRSSKVNALCRQSP